MPNFIVHSYFGDLVSHSLDKDKQKQIVANQDLYYMGANGPDLFFTFRELNFGVPSFANTMQSIKTFEVFEAASKYMQQHPQDNVAYVYFLGLFCHYALDSVVHPYVCYAVDNDFFSLYPAKYQRSIHTIMEVYFDEHIIKNKQNIELTAYSPKHLLAASKTDRYKMAQIYQDVILPIYGVKISNRAMVASFWIAYYFHYLTNDKKGRKRRFYQFLELPIGYGKLSCFLKPVLESNNFDFLNNSRRAFRKVRNESELSTETFEEMLTRAHTLCIELIQKFDAACQGKGALDPADFSINYEGVRDPKFIKK